MAARRFLILASPWFLVSLALLLTNDLYLKAASPGWLTGKLSDFSGLLVFCLFLFPLLPICPKKIAAGVACLFCWWKSPFSDFAIVFVNSTGLTTIGRVVDFTDLIALSVLPLAVHLYQRSQRRQPNLNFARKAVLAPVAMVALLGITGTSKLLITRPVEIRSVESTFELSRADIDATIESLIASRNDECHERREEARTCEIDRVWFTYYVEPDGVRFEFQYTPSDRATRKANRVIESIKDAFSQHGDGLTYIEPLLDPSGQ